MIYSEPGLCRPLVAVALLSEPGLWRPLLAVALHSEPGLCRPLAAAVSALSPPSGGCECSVAP